MKLFFYILVIIIAGGVSFGWSWKRLLDFNSYRKPFIEGSVLTFLILFVSSIWWYFTESNPEVGMTGIFYNLIAFLVIITCNGFILALLFSKKKQREGLS
ncbi:hypothetical protein JOC86_003565 [Bacillus pakistanensis]|uniref:Uncharacterized protein n=1 Tax=Rossellomorea pakistanensis TaxID=992288 RepID=A0ABS2NGS1_9BACI|nr:hypothetical protein [Bacillus pakistanensis]MBM7587013.1 hypothetical protein [Bacillus pakistanensis]